jgi:hypothetical protein
LPDFVRQAFLEICNNSSAKVTQTGLSGFGAIVRAGERSGKRDVHSMNNCGCGAFVVRWKGILRLLLSLLICMAIAGMTWAAGAKDKGPARISVLIATGMPGGTYYQVGLGMASLWTTRLRDIGIRVSAAISEGSMENIEAIRIADADMILVEDLSCPWHTKEPEYTKAGPAGTPSYHNSVARYSSLIDPG